ncbi:MAG: hypothetical protein II249_03825 [Bacteroidaceae bacterium]|jgi:hypothetical protein|nr:hypothetical protein [Bacteroidaceae bacterium]
MKKLFIIALLLLPGIMLCAQDNNRRREGRRPQGSEMRRSFSPEALAKMEADAINEAVGLDSLQYQLVYILKYSDVAAMQDSMKARSARMEKMRKKGEKVAPPRRDDKSREEWMKAREELMKKRRDAMNEQMKQILSPKQYKKYLKFDEERMKNRRPMGGGKEKRKK